MTGPMNAVIAELDMLICAEVLDPIIEVTRKSVGESAKPGIVSAVLIAAAGRIISDTGSAQDVKGSIDRGLPVSAFLMGAQSVDCKCRKCTEKRTQAIHDADKVMGRGTA